MAVALNPVTLNAQCHCIGVDAQRLRQVLDGHSPGPLPALGEPGLADEVQRRCPHLFASAPVFVAPEDLARMAAVVQAVDALAHTPAWRAAVLAQAPDVVHQALAAWAAQGQADPWAGPRGVFMGYDFHLDPQTVAPGQAGRLGLIEVNTNAGGALLNAALAHADLPCCEAVAQHLPATSPPGALEAEVLAMFRAEWALAQAAGWPVAQGRTLQRIAIVDDDPAGQFLYPEFRLFAALFQRAGWQVVVADPAELRWQGGGLWHGRGAAAQRIDLVYKRLTDFDLSQPTSAALRQAWLARAVVLTPHPLAHALMADKRHLIRLSDPGWLAQAGVPEATQALLLQAVPRTQALTPDNAEALWRTRRQWFFKPAGGFGSRAAYRGDKLTRRVWQEMLAGGPGVAQALVAPGERVVPLPDTGPQEGGEPTTSRLKLDLRHYAYAGRVQSVAARLYQGQTTNFRTPGGGFATVHRVGPH